MKTHRILIIAASMATWLLAQGGCSKRAPEAQEPPPQSNTEPAAAVSTSVKSSPVAVQPAAKPKSKLEPTPEAPVLPPVPDILFSLRGLESGQLVNDQPLFVAVRVELPVGSSSPIALAPADGHWSDRLIVDLRAAGESESVLISAQRSGDFGDEASVTLEEGRAAEGTWYFPSAEIAKLNPGDYAVQVSLAISDGAGWRGRVQSEPATFQLVAANKTTNPEQQTQHTLALAREAMMAKEWAQVAQLLDASLAKDPDHLDLLKVRAVVCLEGGDVLSANVCVNRAWARVMREQWKHPPEVLYALSQIVTAGMNQPDAIPKDPLPTWTRLPDAVLAPLPETK